jgi:hypothetical protein
LVPGYSSGSSPSRCRPNVATTFPRVSEAHRSDSGPRSLVRPDWPSSSAYRPLRGGKSRSARFSFDELTFIYSAHSQGLFGLCFGRMQKTYSSPRSLVSLGSVLNL